MSFKQFVLGALVVSGGVALSVANTSAQSAPSPTAGTRLASGLLRPKGIKVGPDDMIYVAEAGTGGYTGRISKIDAVTGARTTVADKLPSDVLEGPADVAFIGSQLYYLQAHGGAFYGFPDTPTGVYRVNSDGTVALVADIDEFNTDNPTVDKNGTAEPTEGGGVAAAMVVRDGTFLVVEGSDVAAGSTNQDQVVQISVDGVITRLATFPANPVLSGITTGETGPLYVAAFGQSPFLAEDGAVHEVGYPTGSIAKVAGGVSGIDDVKIGPGGQLYALSFGDFSPDGPGLLGSGKVLKRDAASGALTPIVTGLTSPTKFTISGDTAYVVNNGQTPQGNDGEVWMIGNVSAVKALPVPIPAEVVASPTAPSVLAPNTGTGGAAAGRFGRSTLLTIAIAGAALVASGTRMRCGRRA